MKDKSNHFKNKAFQRLWSFRYAYQGIRHSVLKQANLRIHLFAAVVVIISGIWVKLEYFEWIAVIIVTVMVIAAELINTAIEELTNIISPEYQRRAGFVKDAAAGAVLIVAVGAAITGIMIFLPKLMYIAGIHF